MVSDDSGRRPEGGRQTPDAGLRTPDSGADAAAGQDVASDAEVLAGIADIARKQLDWHGAVSREMPLLETFELDSLRQLTLVVEVEDRFRIRLDDRDEQSIATVGDLVDVIRRKLAGPAADAH